MVDIKWKTSSQLGIYDFGDVLKNIIQLQWSLQKLSVYIKTQGGFSVLILLRRIQKSNDNRLFHLKMYLAVFYISCIDKT